MKSFFGFFGGRDLIISLSLLDFFINFPLDFDPSLIVFFFWNWLTTDLLCIIIPELLSLVSYLPLREDDETYFFRLLDELFIVSIFFYNIFNFYSSFFISYLP